MYTYQRLAREYHVCTQTVWRHAIKGQWQIGREEAEKQILRRCLMATAKLLETAAAGATERLESGEGSLKEMLAAPDGVHLSAGNGYGAWVTYLRNHAKYSADNSWTMGSIYSAQ